MKKITLLIIIILITGAMFVLGFNYNNNCADLAQLVEQRTRNA